MYTYIYTYTYAYIYIYIRPPQGRPATLRREIHAMMRICLPPRTSPLPKRQQTRPTAHTASTAATPRHHLRFT